MQGNTNKIGYAKGTCVWTQCYNSCALIDLQPDCISVRYRRYPTQILSVSKQLHAMPCIIVNYFVKETSIDNYRF